MTQGDTKTDTGGNVYLSSPQRHVLYKASGLSASVFAGSTDQSGYADGTGDGVRFNGPSGIGVDNRADGGLYVADTMNDCIRKVDFRERSSLAAGTPGLPGTMHGDENPIDEAVFDNPRGVASVGSNLYVTDTNNDCVWYVDVAAAGGRARRGGARRVGEPERPGPDGAIRPSERNHDQHAGEPAGGRGHGQQRGEADRDRPEVGRWRDRERDDARAGVEREELRHPRQAERGPADGRDHVRRASVGDVSTAWTTCT